MRLKALPDALLSLVLPPRCAGCAAIVATADSFCGTCFAALAFITPPMCAVCGDPFDADAGDGARCHRCRQRRPAFTAARAAFAYADPAKAVVLALKHGDKTEQARLMARQMARAGSGWFGADAVLVPVPLHRWRLWRRGFNQAALIARNLARRTGTPVSLDALERIRSTASSGAMGRAERFANVDGAFVCGRADAVAGRAVVLVDDVLTTGATAEACALALFDAGATTVRLLTFARVVRSGAAPHINLVTKE